MRHPALLDRERAILVVIDLQLGYRDVLFEWDRTVAAGALLVRGALLLGLPLLVTEQYPKGLGFTVPELRSQLAPDFAAIEKRTMSCCGADAFERRLADSGRRQVVVAGIEAHACVNQTVHDLIARGYQVHVARDAISSRRAADIGPAWDKMRAAGMLPTSSEQALLELVRSADAPEFKAIQRLLKAVPVVPLRS
jgi:nicotinamidase-related amidase